VQQELEVSSRDQRRPGRNHGHGAHHRGRV
jgi:hypothetical protein